MDMLENSHNSNTLKIYGISHNPYTNNYMIVLNDNSSNYCMNCHNKYTNIENKWCKPCQINNLKANFISWTSRNEEIDKFIQEKQLKINNYNDIVFEWIPY